MTAALKTLYQHQKQEALNDFLTFLRFQSVSTDPQYAPQVLDCAHWLANYLKNIGFHVEQWPTKGYPTLFASHTKAGADKPTLLIYNHYDVQPVDPLEQWETLPFDPQIRNGAVYARGAQDNKGQCFYVIQALKALLKRDKTLPINIKLCIEGEEECGSAGLAGIVQSKKEALQADYLAIVDVGLRKKDAPSITLGTRGLVTMDLEVIGSDTDLHSGSHGGLAYNPNRALAEILAALHDAQGKVAIPGFYDAVLPMNQKERAQLDTTFDEDAYRKGFGCEAHGGETSYPPIDRLWVRPTLEINGISGGYAGVGFKTVIPAKAHAKISCRLVPNQDPQKIGKLVADHIKKIAPKAVQVKVTVHAGRGAAARANPFSPIAQAFSKAYSEVFQSPCQMIFDGASIPIVPELSEVSGSEFVLVGLGLAEDRIHAPNEHFGLDRFEQGFLTIARTIELLGGNEDA